MAISRRRVIQGALSGLAFASSGLMAQVVSSAKSMRIPWKNWAGSASCLPENRATPKNTDELVELLKSSEGVVRAVGAGHSWSPLVPTDDTLLSLRRFNGLIASDGDAMTATLGAGTKISAAGPLLEEVSQGMINLPDIDEQTLAGAFATGTHGTGLNLPALHDSVEGLTLVTANGEVLECGREKNADLFNAAKVSLGSLGIVTEYRLKNRAAYNLERRDWFVELEDLLEGGEGLRLAEKHRHFEFFYIPFSGKSLCHSMDFSEKPAIARIVEDDAEVLKGMKTVRDTLGGVPIARKAALKTLMATMKLPPVAVDRSWKLLTNDRTLPIYEMEYQLPAEHGPKAMREIVDYIESNHPEFFVPMEYRYVDGDDAWLSEFYGRKSVSISVHRFREGEDPWKVFEKVQKIFLKYEGRPHWGKVHNLEYKQLTKLYPKFEDFRKLRAELDPAGRFVNEHIKQIFNV